MIIDIVITFFCISIFIFFIILIIFAFKSMRRMNEHTQILSEFNVILEKELDIHHHNYNILRHDVLDSNEELCDKIDELRLQVGIISGRMSQTIHMPTPLQTQESLPYSGAKRGPKPKKGISNDQSNSQ